jgi:hypothetical protein
LCTLAVVTASCPICQAPASPNAPRCEECLVSLDWRSGSPVAYHPPIKPGDPLYFTDLRRGLLPGREQPAGTLSDGSRYEATPQGALVTVSPRRAFDAFERRLRSRNMCVRASFLTLDPGTTVACLARIEMIQAAKLAYVLEVDAAGRRFCLDRGFSSPDVAHYSPLVDWTPSPAVAPVGQANVVELRAQGPTLELRLNDQHVRTIHDAVLGIGAAGLRISSLPGSTRPGRALVQWFEMREVVA